MRGPNIGTPPINDKMPEQIKGTVGIKVGDKITTDHIMPAGARLKYRSNVPKYSEFVFEPIDPTFPKKGDRNQEKRIAHSHRRGRILWPRKFERTRCAMPHVPWCQSNYSQISGAHTRS